MPRGRRPAVRYFLDEITGNVIALGQGAMRVLKEIGGAVASAKPTVRRSRTGKRIGRPPKAAATTEAPKRRGRPPKTAAAADPHGPGAGQEARASEKSQAFLISASKTFWRERTQGA